MNLRKVFPYTKTMSRENTWACLKLVVQSLKISSPYETNKLGVKSNMALIIVHIKPHLTALNGKSSILLYTELVV